MLPQFGLLTLRNHLTKMAACQKPQSHSLGPCIILGGCFCYWFWSVLYHQNLWVTLDRYRKIDSIVIDRHIHDCNYFRWFHCGSRIAWPLRRIANPVVSHLGSSNLPCRAINQRNHQIRQPLTPLPFCGFLLQQLCATS